MAGRAGRLGFRETGRAILLADTPLERHRLFEKYVAAPHERIRSSFAGDEVGTWLIRLFAQVEAVPADAVVRLLTNTYGGYLAARRDPNWPERMTHEVRELVARMEAHGLFERDAQGFLRLTLLGRACGQSSITLTSALWLVEVLRRPRQGLHTPVALMVLVQGLPEMDQQHTPLFKRGQGEVRWPRDATLIFGPSIVRALQERAPDFHAYYARAKRACLLDAWTRGEPTAEIEQRFTHNPFNAVGAGSIRAIADLTRFHLRSAASIAEVAVPETAPDPEAMERLLQQLEAGVPSDALELLTIQVPLARGEYLALVAAGLRTPAAVVEASVAQLTEILSPARASQLTAMRAVAVAGAGMTPSPA
jgi:replicative superfamily II helicase